MQLLDVLVLHIALYITFCDGFKIVKVTFNKQSNIPLALQYRCYVIYSLHV